jgi:sugar phosphate isomerase/epimerase
MSLQRRTFLCSLALGGLAAARLRNAAAIEPIKRTETGGLKLSLAAYSLRAFLQKKPGAEGALDLAGFIDYCASLGLEGTELTQYYFPDNVTDEYLFGLKRQAHLVGVDISGGAIGNKFTMGPGAELDEQIAHTEKWIRHYATLGAPVIRVFAGTPPNGVSEDEAIDRAVPVLKRACDFAGRHGVMLAIENHDFTSNVDRLLRIVEVVDSPWFGVNFDSGNLSHSQDPYGDMERMAPFAVNAQVKVAINSAHGSQPANLKRIVEILRGAGYAGYLVLEYEAEEDPYTAIPRYVDQLRKLV